MVSSGERITTQGHNIGATISPCWTRTDTDTNYRWGGRTGGTATGGTGPGGDHTSGFGSYVYTEASYSTGTPVGHLDFAKYRSKRLDNSRDEVLVPHVGTRI
jgi:hypothetical protein